MIKLPSSLLIAAVICLPACSSGSGADLSGQAVDTAVSASTIADDTQTLVSNDSHTLILDDALDVNADIEYLRVKHHLVECEGFVVSHCLLVQTEGSDEWVYFYDEIVGFDYEWGTDYEILVQTQTVEPVLPFDSNVQYDLVEVLSSTPQAPDEAFTYTTRNSQERIVEIAPQQFSLLGEKAFVCSEDDCANLRSVIAQNQSTVLSFNHSSNPDEPLRLEAVLCVDAAQSFTESCL